MLRNLDQFSEALRTHKSCWSPVSYGLLSSSENYLQLA